MQPKGVASPLAARGKGAFSRSKNLPELVNRAIRQQISQGHLRPGDQLTESAIAEALGVSRTPVRESFLVLAREGLLVREGRSFTLPSLTLEDVNDIGEMRRLLEPTALRNAVDRMTPAILSELKLALSAQKAADTEADVEAFVVANTRFRDALLSMVVNRRLHRAIQMYGDHMHILRSRFNDRRWREVVIKNLSDLLRAITAVDADAAVAIWLKHIDGAEMSAREWLRSMTEEETQPLLPAQRAHEP